MAQAVLELAIGSENMGQSCIYTHHFFSPDNGITSQEALIADWQGAMQALLTDTVPSTIVFTSITCREVASSALSGAAPTEVAINLAGTRPGFGDLLPPWVVLRVSEKTDVIGRRRRGRSFFSGAADGDMVAGLWDTGSETFFDLCSLYSAAMLDRYGPSGPSDFDWVVFSRKSWTDTGWIGSSVIITSVVPRVDPSHLRSRRVGS